MEQIIQYFRENNFPSQEQLEKILSNLSVATRYSPTKLVDFKGQLEQSSDGKRIYWNLRLETQTQTQVNSVVAALGKALYGKKFDSKYDNTVSGRAQDCNLNKEDRLSINHPDYEPSIISRENAEIIEDYNQLIEDYNRIMKHVDEDDDLYAMLKNDILKRNDCVMYVSSLQDE